MKWLCQKLIFHRYSKKKKKYFTFVSHTPSSITNRWLSVVWCWCLCTHSISRCMYSLNNTHELRFIYFSIVFGSDLWFPTISWRNSTWNVFCYYVLLKYTVVNVYDTTTMTYWSYKITANHATQPHTVLYVAVIHFEANWMTNIFINSFILFLSKNSMIATIFDLLKIFNFEKTEITHKIHNTKFIAFHCIRG